MSEQPDSQPQEQLDELPDEQVDEQVDHDTHDHDSHDHDTHSHDARDLDRREDGSAGTDERIAAAVERLDTLGDRPPAEHVEVYEEVHAVLQDSLAQAQGDQQNRAPGGAGQ